MPQFKEERILTVWNFLSVHFMMHAVNILRMLTKQVRNGQRICQELRHAV